MAALLTVNATLEEHFAAAGAKDPTAAAAIQGRDRIDPGIIGYRGIDPPQKPDNLGIKAGSATRIHAYCQQLKDVVATAATAAAAVGGKAAQPRPGGN